MKQNYAVILICSILVTFAAEAANLIKESQIVDYAVKNTGDTMTGPLIVESDLTVQRLICPSFDPTSIAAIKTALPTSTPQPTPTVGDVVIDDELKSKASSNASLIKVIGTPAAPTQITFNDDKSDMPWVFKTTSSDTSLIIESDDQIRVNELYVNDLRIFAGVSPDTVSVIGAEIAW